MLTRLVSKTVKCSCLRPHLVGEAVPFMNSTIQGCVTRRDYKIWCLECNKFYGWMRKKSFKLLGLEVLK